MVSTAHKPTPFLLIVIVCLLAVPPVASAAPPGSVYGACFQLDAAHPHSAACSAEIAAHPLPDLVHPVTYDPQRDGVALPVTWQT